MLLKVCVGMNARVRRPASGNEYYVVLLITS